jgi:hypothetical protein
VARTFYRKAFENHSFDGRSMNAVVCALLIDSILDDLKTTHSVLHRRDLSAKLRLMHIFIDKQKGIVGKRKKLDLFL